MEAVHDPILGSVSRFCTESLRENGVGDGRAWGQHAGAEGGGCRALSSLALLPVQGGGGGEEEEEKTTQVKVTSTEPVGAS
jgi:hypothetical protein